MSWTKSDAQNLSFATSFLELRRLNVAAQPKTWQQLAATLKPSKSSEQVESRKTADRITGEKNDMEDFSAFQKRLHESAGKSVIVVVLDEARTNFFKFVAK